MSFYITNYELEKIIEEDINPVDLTSELIGLNKFNAEITYKARHNMMVCCTEEADEICKLIGIKVKDYKKSGTYIKEGEIFFAAEGKADKVHLVWRTLLRLLEGYCGIATRTYDLLGKIKKYSNKINLVTTRKNLAGTKKLSIKAVISGGAYPHRMGLSETILLFDQHLKFIKSEEALQVALANMKSKVIEKKIGVEAKDYEEGLNYIKMGFDFVQLDKFSSDNVKKFVKDAKSINKNIVVVAAGNINNKNIEEYAQTEVDVIVTSSVYFGKPCDIKVDIKNIE